MKKTEYCSSLTEAEFKQIKPCLTIKRPPKRPLLNILNAILYICDGGIKWRDVPHDFAVPWQTVYWYLKKWTKEGIWQAVHDQVVMLRRMAKGGAPAPSFAVVDTQTVHNTPTAATEVGYDGGKKIKGRKRIVVVDSQGHLLSVRVVNAACHDGTATLQWWQQELNKTPLLTDIERLYGDRHFGGKFKEEVEAETAVKVITAHEQIGVTKDGMKLHKKRWVVERTIAWELCSRRLTRDFERKPEHAEAFCYISSLSRILRNLN
jgi:putative transposase